MHNGWDKLSLGTHLCSIYSGRDEQFSTLSSFFSEGFNNEERCIYIFDENTPEEISSRLPNGVVISDGSVVPKGLEILNYKELYTKDGFFNPDRMISLVEDTIADSLKQNYTGIRVAGEMSWVVSSDTPPEKLIEYEQKLNVFYPTQKVIGICQFNEEKFTPELLIEMIRMHPYIVIHGKIYENQYFYTDPKYADEALNDFKAADYKTILSIIMDEGMVVG
jgi:hypothetical protein